MNPWTYDPSPAISQSLSEQFTVFPRERDLTHTILRIAWTLCVRAVLHSYFQLQIVGRERLPRSGSYVLAANHSSHLDAVSLSAALPIRSIHRAFAVAAKDYFFSSVWRSMFSAIFVNALPFDRTEEKRRSLELCADVLDVSDNVLVMFPEGTRSTTGEIQSFKKGLGVLTAGTDRLVVPAYIDGAFQAWPKGARMPRPRRVRVLIGEPIDFGHLPRTDEGFLQVAHDVEAAVRTLQAGARGTSPP